eukprot:CAMPEP_0113846946 /NCGR_PEP_ID=MMETSP0372-20130328/1591_1 /TAXON_ID=340204 /ORGANISM="Lankesteria abbotti" /LENGTH=252 /DNA_ID=CAMNT_0000816149 /DNA_START=113 /DNA_END=871 /DNA_ORIENTATION=- /assembly_acc=CAM_ASM_000359
MAVWGLALLSIMVAPYVVSAVGPCRDDVVLQLLHIQDVSHSFDNDFSGFLLKMGALVDQLHFFDVQTGLVSFADKPILPYGDPKGDYCYREDADFGDKNSYLFQLNRLENMSGRDFKESQLDALKYGLESDSLGWNWNDVDDTKVVKRVVLLATDAIPHLKGDASELVGGTSCFDTDYPSISDIKDILASKSIKPIVMVSDDILEHWVELVSNEWAGVDVVSVSEPAATLDQLIEDYIGLDPACSEVSPVGK